MFGRDGQLVARYLKLDFLRDNVFRIKRKMSLTQPVIDLVAYGLLRRGSQ